MRTITPIFSIIIALLIFFFFAQPKFAEINATQNESLQYQNAAAKAQELNAELSAKLTEKRAYPVEALEKLDALVPESIDEIKILNDLNEIAKSHNMLFGNVSVSAADEFSNSEGVGEITAQTVNYADLITTDISFSLIGSYEQFKAFLNDIEQSLVMLEVLNISFSTGESALQQYEISARVFSLPPIE